MSTKTDDYKKLIDEAANHEEASVDPDVYVSRVQAFKAGAQFVLDNPPPEVETMLHFLKKFVRFYITTKKDYGFCVIKGWREVDYEDAADFLVAYEKARGGK